MFEAIKKYAVFDGRAARSEFWLFQLFCAVASFVGGAIDGLLGTVDSSDWGPFGLVTILALILPLIAVSVRRCHDLNKSGWLAVLAFVPLLGLGVLIYFAFPGTAGANRYGEDPLDKHNLPQG